MTNRQIGIREVRRTGGEGQGREGGLGKLVCNITEWTGKNMVEDGQVTVDRCKAYKVKAYCPLVAMFLKKIKHFSLLQRNMIFLGPQLIFTLALYFPHNGIQFWIEIDVLTWCPHMRLCDASMIDFIPDAHTLFTVVASVVSGSPVNIQFSLPVTVAVLVIT